MTSKTNLFLFLVITAILISSPLASGNAFAASDDDQHDGQVNKKSRVWTGDGPPLPKLGKVGDLYIDNHNNIYNIYKKTTKNTWTDVPDIQGTPGTQGPQGLPGISPTVTTEPPGDNCSEGGLKITDSFFDVFYVCDGVPGLKGDKGDKGDQGPPGIIQTQICPSNHYVSGIDSNGVLICTPLPDFTSTSICGDGLVEPPEQCDLGAGNGATSSCSTTCTVQTPDLCLGVDIDDGIECTIDACINGISVHSYDNCPPSVCGDNLVSGIEQCDDGNTVDGDGCSSTCVFENTSGDIYVSPSGFDSNPGTMDNPVRTIDRGLNIWQTQSSGVIRLAEGTYNEKVTLVDGASIYGGYDVFTWTQSPSNISVIASPETIGVQGINIVSSTTLDHVTITTADASTSGSSTYGVHCNNCDSLTLSNNIISAGDAGSGSSGINGANGISGISGSPGFGGTCDGNIAGALGGNGGGSTIGRTGGNGGQGGNYGANSGITGGTGQIGTPGGFGGSGGDPGNYGGNGQNGANGVTGPSGTGGSSGTVVSGFWQGYAGANGLIGTHGNGGGGGGGGGGQGCFFCDDGNGNGGGGGGSGGAGGNAGTGGTSGGGSFGVFLIDSTGITLTNNEISSGNGGNGGNGGSGGSGGNGGIGANGGSVCTSEIGGGGKGGNGGSGGNGGHGGGGAGGPSYALYKYNTIITSSGNILIAGSGGSGGLSSGNSGSNGISATQN